jgi:threonine dehydrogenase-like Zn-dependent dehydrogenase
LVREKREQSWAASLGVYATLILKRHKLRAHIHVDDRCPGSAYSQPVRAVVFDMVDPEFPARLAELPEPELPGADWARVAVTTGGICGSDLHLFAHNTGPSPTLAGIGTFPFVLGHETAGRVVEAGGECAVALGTRVALDPCIPCLPRGLPLCDNCARGWTSSCLNLDSGVLTGGRSLGFTQGLGGGWGDTVLAHSSMLHPLPDAVGDRGASLYEPVSIACHGLLRAAPTDGDPVLIVGAGIIGLAALAALRGLFPGCPVTVLARHPHQATAATACGADNVVLSDASNGHWEELAVLSGSRVVGRKKHQMLMGGFPYVVEAVGSPGSVTEALRAVAHRGTVLLLGAAGISEVDLTPIWYKEAALVGSIDHTVDTGSAPGLAGGPDRHSVDRALDVLAGGLLPDDVVVTHEFGLEDYRTAIETAIDRHNSHAIKVVFRPQS